MQYPRTKAGISTTRSLRPTLSRSYSRNHCNLPTTRMDYMSICWQLRMEDSAQSCGIVYCRSEFVNITHHTAKLCSGSCRVDVDCCSSCRCEERPSLNIFYHCVYILAEHFINRNRIGRDRSSLTPLSTVQWWGGGLPRPMAGQVPHRQRPITHRMIYAVDGRSLKHMASFIALWAVTFHHTIRAFSVTVLS